MKTHIRFSQALLSQTLLSMALVAGCAHSPIVKANGHGAVLTVDIHNDSAARPGAVRLAAADYTIDGHPLVSLRPKASDDVPDAASWSGAVTAGEHVLEATLSYPPRGASADDDMQFRVQRAYRFRMGAGGALRIRVDESVEDGGLAASLDKRLGVRFQQY